MHKYISHRKGPALLSLRVKQLHGLYINESKVESAQEMVMIRKTFPSEFAMIKGDPTQQIVSKGEAGL